MNRRDFIRNGMGMMSFAAMSEVVLAAGTAKEAFVNAVKLDPVLKDVEDTVS